MSLLKKVKKYHKEIFVLCYGVEQYTKTLSFWKVINKNFKKIGETKFSADQFDISMTGVTKDGLLVARRDLYNYNDNEFTFSVFSPNKIE